MLNDQRSRIAVLVEDDRTWMLHAWIRMLPLLKAKYDVVGIWVFPSVLVKHRGGEIPRWYLGTFGLWDFLGLGVFAVGRKLRLVLGGISNWESLALRHGLPLLRGRNPNDSEVSEWLQTNAIDIACTQVGFIIKVPLIRSAKLGLVNKHASLLPSCRGLFPYFWALVHDEPLGVTLHLIDERIDTGPILCQVRYPRNKFRSMLDFYRHIFSAYPELMLEAVENLRAGRFLRSQATVQSSLFSLPSKKDVQLFRRKGGKVVDWKDIVQDFFHG